MRGTWGTPVMPAAGAADVTGPVAYPGWLVLVVVVPPLLVVAYYVTVTWWTRPVRDHPGVDVDAARRACLSELDAIEVAATAGDLSPRLAHQRISATVRRFLADVGEPAAAARTRARADAEGPRPLADLLGVVYPPEFAPGEQTGQTGRLDRALRGARDLVGAWTP